MPEIITEPSLAYLVVHEGYRDQRGTQHPQCWAMTAHEGSAYLQRRLDTVIKNAAAAYRRGLAEHAAIPQHGEPGE